MKKAIITLMLAFIVSAAFSQTTKPDTAKKTPTYTLQENNLIDLYNVINSAKATIINTSPTSLDEAGRAFVNIKNLDKEALFIGSLYNEAHPATDTTKKPLPVVKPVTVGKVKPNGHQK